MLCQTCQIAFKDDRQGYEVQARASLPQSTIVPSPFLKAAHHTLPELLLSAQDGCHLCAFLWDAAPLDVRRQFYELLGADDDNVEWVRSYFTIDRSIFDEVSKRCWVEYKYLDVERPPEEYVMPLKRQFRLLPSYDVDPLMNQSNIGTNTGSQQSFTTAATWIRQCTEKHSLCNAESRSASRLPTRLLDVGESNSTSCIRLVQSSGLPLNTKYLTLSHCWGLKPVHKLTTLSASSFYKGIELFKLSRTFQDAVFVTREFQLLFGVQYLWIDSLCIIQDSVEDWQSESAVMGEVYQNAFCTIAATASSDGDGGLFFERDPVRRKPCPISAFSRGRSRKYFYCLNPNNWEENVSKAPLNGRSWVLQERLLSRRVLHFAADQLYWECAELEASENFPAKLPEGLGEKFKDWFQQRERPRENMQVRKSEMGSAVSRNAYARWERIVHAYTSGKLTKVTDKLVALSGVAREWQNRAFVGPSYLAGLWRSDLVFGLLWDLAEPRSSEQQSSNEHYVAPSWSWASRTGAITWETDNWLSAKSLVKIEDATVSPLGLDDMGQVSSGYIRLSGMLIQASLNRVHQPGSPQPLASLEVKNSPLYGAINRSDDGFSFKDPIPSPIYCFPFLRSRRNDVPIYRGLFLVPSGADDGRFRRYGTFTAERIEDVIITSRSTVSLEGEIRKADGSCVITLV